MKKIKVKTLASVIVALAVLIATWQIQSREFQFFTNIRKLTFDTYQTIKPRESTDSAVVIVDVDEASLRELGQWPWPRAKMAEIVDKITGAGAFSIGFDMVFPETDRTNPSELFKESMVGDNDALLELISKLPNNDEVLADSIAKSSVVLGFMDGQGNQVNSVSKIAGISWLGGDLSEQLQQMNGTISSLPNLQKKAKGSAAFNVGFDQSDDLIRTIPLFFQAHSRVFPTLSIETLRIAIETATGEQQSFLIKTSLASGENSGGAQAITDVKVANFEIPTTSDGQIQIYYAPFDQTKLVSAAKILKSSKQELAEIFEGKIVLVGASASGLRDIRSTALRERVPGVAIHAQIIDQIMEGNFLYRPDWALGLERIILAITSLLIITILPFWGAIFSALFGGILAVVIIAGSWLAFSRYGLLIDPVFPTIFSFLLYAFLTAMLFAFAEKEKRFVRNAFQHYIAPELLGKLEQSPDALKLGGEIKELSLMFMDIRGFTAISEKLNPQELVSFLNKLLSPLSKVIQQNDGAIDKYIGDSIMAFWNAPLDVERHAEKSCVSALQMLSSLDDMNHKDAFGFEQNGLDKVEIGIGINLGDGCVGNMGSASRFDYSVIGDTVNIAARLESESKNVGWPILVSKTTMLACPNFAFLDAGKLWLKGKSEKQNVYALLGDEAFLKSDTFKDLVEKHKNLVDAISSKNASNIKKFRKKSLEGTDVKFHKFFNNLAFENFSDN